MALAIHPIVLVVLACSIMSVSFAHKRKLKEDRTDSDCTCKAWLTLTRFNVHDSIPQTKPASDISSCQADCLKNSTCNAIVYDDKSKDCWFVAPKQMGLLRQSDKFNISFHACMRCGDQPYVQPPECPLIPVPRA